jgi:ribonucleoside-diphosphate reductase alpha chain
MRAPTPNHRWLNDDSRAFLSRGYLKPGQSAEERITEIAERAGSILGLSWFAEKFERYMHAGYISLSSPVWSNFGLPNALPISCNNSYFEDSIESILSKTAEIGMQTKLGAGTSAYLGALRPRGSDIRGGGSSFGPVHFAELLETTTNVVSQGSVRRGSCAVYLPIEHADINEFLDMREEGSVIQHLSMGVTVGDKFMEKVREGDPAARTLWLRVLKKRFESGYPYIFFTDTVNRGAPQPYIDNGMTIWSSNLCSEIALASSADESFVCNLASVNDLHWDEWKDTDLAQIMVLFLDAVMSEYIEKTKDIPLMATAHRFAKNQRALGIGRLGWHSYLQSKMIPFEGMQAKLINVQIQQHLDEETMKASQWMASVYGEPELLRGYGYRHITRLAIAPTTSSSFILGQVSPSTEPLDSNYFVKDLQKGKFTYRNPYLEVLLEQLGRNDDATWKSILMTGGSVQHLDFLTQEQKDVFKTFGEISQNEIIVQAAGRQKFLDQSQSLNLKIHPDSPLKDVNALMFTAWELGVKTLYYQRSTNPAQEYVRNLLSCVSCEA